MGQIWKNIFNNVKKTTCIYIYTKLLGCFASIFYLNCEHVLFVYILKQRRKKFCGFKKKFADFQEFKFFLQNQKPSKHIFLKFYHS